MGRTSLQTRAARRNPSAKALAKSRVTAIDKMPEALRVRLRRIEGTISDAVADNLRYYWSLGELCRDIRDNPETYLGEDGTPGLRLLEEALSTQARTLRNSLRFVDLYDVEALAQLIDLKNEETGFRLHWGHVIYLLSVADETKRTSLGEQAVAKMLEPKALHDLIKKKTGRSGGHGRTHEMPKTLDAQLRQILSVTEQWQRKSDTVWNVEDEDQASVYGNLLMLSYEAMTEEFAEELQNVVEAMQQVAATATRNVSDGQQVLEYLQEGLRAKARAVEETEAEKARVVAAVQGQKRVTPRTVKV